jgi:hypothetical protein
MNRLADERMTTSYKIVKVIKMGRLRNKAKNTSLSTGEGSGGGGK